MDDEKTVFYTNVIAEKEHVDILFRIRGLSCTFNHIFASVFLFSSLRTMEIYFWQEVQLAGTELVHGCLFLHISGLSTVALHRRRFLHEEYHQIAFLLTSGTILRARCIFYCCPQTSERQRSHGHRLR